MTKRSSAGVANSKAMPPRPCSSISMILRARCAAFPWNSLPADSVAKALARHQRARQSSPWRSARLTLYSMAAAIAVFLGAPFFLNDSSPSQEPDTLLVTKDKSPAPSSPVQKFPKGESPNLKRIRSARAAFSNSRSDASASLLRTNPNTSLLPPLSPDHPPNSPPNIMNPFKAILTIAISLAIALPGIAENHERQDDRQIFLRTKSEVRSFLKEHFPEPLEHLRHAEEEDDEKAVEKFWPEANTFVGEFHLTRQDVGEEAAETFLIMRRTEFIADRLVDEFHSEEDEAGQDEIKGELREVLAKHLKQSLALDKLELERARHELEEATQELEEIASHLEELLDEELHERLFGLHEEDEEDDDNR